MFNRWIENGLTDVLEEEGMGCIPFSPLAQGMLTNRYLQEIPADSRAAKPHGFLKRDQVTEERVGKVQRLNAIAQARGQSMAQMAIAWVLRLPVVSSALIGASRVQQIDDVLGALNNLAFSQEELARIDAILAD
jgi:L-glyceraldehyde 3-phosphate reductase